MAIEVLLHFDGANGSTTFVDSSGNNHAVTYSGTAQHSTTGQVFGSACCLLGSTNSTLAVDTLPALAATCTHRFRMLLNATPTGGLVFECQGAMAGVGLAFSSGQYRLNFFNGFVWSPTSVSFTPAVGTPIAISIENYTGDVWALYVDGVKIGEATQDSKPIDAQYIIFSSQFNADVKIDEYLFDNGSAYANGAASYAVELAPFPDPKFATAGQNDGQNESLAVIATQTQTATAGQNSDNNEALGVWAIQTQTAEVRQNDGINSSYLLYGKYLAINLAVDNKSVTTFSNFNFTGSCQFNGKTLFINEQGLFEYGGLTDNGDTITPSLKTGKMDSVMGRMGIEHSNKLKKIATSKVRVSCDKVGGALDLNVTADTNTYPYYQAVTHDGVATHNIPVGRGIKYNFIQLELVANGCSKLDIDSIDYDPKTIQRSER